MLYFDFVSDPESESIRNPESESESEQPHHNSTPLVNAMGVATGGWGNVSPQFEILGMSPSEIAISKENFLYICQNFYTFQYFQNKGGKIREEIEI